MPNDKLPGVAILECCQEIPCNPCTTVCKTGAITKESLNSCPTFHAEKCIGCKLCVASCPGQAIFFQIPAYSDETATITFPYEYRPLPVQGQKVTAVNRMGQPVCEASVLAVDTLKPYNKTVLVTLEIPLPYKDEIRFMKRLSKEEH